MKQIKHIEKKQEKKRGKIQREAVQTDIKASKKHVRRTSEEIKKNKSSSFCLNVRLFDEDEHKRKP